MRALNLRERAILRALGPHTRLHVVQFLGECPNLRLSSGYRTPAHNKRVGGVPNSFHLRRRAVDVVGPHWDLVRGAGIAWALRVGPRCTGPEEVILEDLDGPNQHLHLAW